MSPESRIGKGRPTTPSPIVEQLGGVIDTSEKAEEFLRLFFTTDWQPRSPKTGRKLQSGFTATYEELNRIKKEQPEILRNVLTDIGATDDLIELWLSPPPWQNRNE